MQKSRKNKQNNIYVKNRENIYVVILGFLTEFLKTNLKKFAVNCEK